MADTFCAPRQIARSALRLKMIENDDAQLLRLIASHRSSEAFEAFYGRYGMPAYNLARFMTGSPESAEDAVQDAMARIWRSAGTFRPEVSKNARSWTLRIVANACTRIMQRQVSRPESRAMEIELHDAPSTARSPEQEQGNVEILDVLRGVLAKLAEDDRQMVALYFGAGLTYEEIAHECAMRPRTVASRIQKALETMRGRLSRMGMASAAPLLGMGTLHDALMTAYEAPAGLRKSVMSRLATDGNSQVTEQSRRGVGTSGSSSLISHFGVFAAVVVAAGAVIWWQVQHTGSASPAPNTPHTIAEPKPVTSKTEKQVPPKLVHLKWNFENSPPEDLKPAKGDWAWVPAKPGAPAGMSCLQGRTLIRLPEESTLDRCWQVSMRVYFVNAGAPAGAFGSRECANFPGIQFEQWSNVKVFPANTPILTCSYLMRDWEIGTYMKLSGELIGINVSKVQPESSISGYLVCSFRSCVVQELELQEITPDSIPEPLQDPERLIKEMNLRPLGSPESSTKGAHQ